MSVEVTSQTTMALKTLSPLAMKEVDVYTLKNGEDSLHDETEFNGQLPEDENPSEITEESKFAPNNNMSLETEDEILNKFDTNDSAIQDPIPEKLEDKLLDDVDDFETITDEALNGIDKVSDSDTLLTNGPILENGIDVDDDIAKEEANVKKDIPCENSINNSEGINDVKCNLVNGINDIKHNDINDIVDNSIKDTEDSDITDPEDNVIKDIKDNGRKVIENNVLKDFEDDIQDFEDNAIKDLVDNVVNEVEDDVKTKALQDAELLKEQIMDTEDLLQIVDDDKNTQRDSEIYDDTLEQEEESDSDKPIGTDVNDEILDIEDEFEADQITTDDHIVKDGTEYEAKDSKDSSEAEVEASEMEGQVEPELESEDVSVISEVDAEIRVEPEVEAEVIPMITDVETEAETTPIINEVETDKDVHMMTEVHPESEGAALVAGVDVEDVPMITEAHFAAILDENSDSGDKDILVIDEKNTESVFSEKEVDDNTTTKEHSESISERSTFYENATFTSAPVAGKSIEEAPKISKRALSHCESETETKKPKLTDNIDDLLSEDADLARAINKVSSLNSFSDFMRNRDITKLSRVLLEEFCLQKMCEAILHKSEVGELRHQMGVQEQMIEMWRKEVVQLSKQARDLEIVNKRLLHEVRLKSDRDKPLIPVKITRSVGLQVRSDNMLNVVAPKRRTNRPQPGSIIQALAPKMPQPQTKSITSPIKTVPTPAKSKITTPKANVLLSQALAAASMTTGTNVSNATNIISKPSPGRAPQNTSVRVIPVKSPVGKTAPPKVTTATAPTTNTPKSVERNFIDLTDEDDRRPANVSAPTSTTTVTPTGVRIVKAATNGVSSNNVTHPRIMYVYNNQLHQGVLATDPNKPGTQKLMLKLNSNMIGQTNGVLTTVPSGSLAVNGTPLRPGQPVRLSTPVNTVRNALPSNKTSFKHPAPLPAPPLAQLSVAARKAIPPRPHLTIRRSSGGIVLSWKMPYILDNYEAIASYQLYAYQETSAPPNSDMWRRVGDVKALALPMACTLTQFADGNKYHFAVRAVDVHKRLGQFSEPEQILL